MWSCQIAYAATPQITKQATEDDLERLKKDVETAINKQVYWENLHRRSPGAAE